MTEEKLTLRKELTESIKNYPKTWKEYFKGLAPAVVISSIGAAGGQWLANHLGYDSNFAMTASAYVCGYIPGYSYFFGQEYIKNKKKYPKGIISKEFGEFVGTFMASDYVADFTTFTPAFIASNLWMANNTEIHPALRSIIAWNSSAMLYISAMAGLHPVTRRVTQGINHGLESLVKKIKKKSNDWGLEE
jgi:hypothetical protein